MEIGSDLNEDYPQEEPITPAKTKRSFTISTKLEVVNYAHSACLYNAAKEYGIDRVLIRRWCNSKEKLQEAPASRSGYPAQGAS